MFPMMPPKTPKQPCDECKGEGKILLFNLYSKCEKCDGKGEVDVPDTITTTLDDVVEPLKLDDDDGIIITGTGF